MEIVVTQYVMVFINLFNPRSIYWFPRKTLYEIMRANIINL